MINVSSLEEHKKCHSLYRNIYLHMLQLHNLTTEEKKKLKCLACHIKDWQREILIPSPKYFLKSALN